MKKTFVVTGATGHVGKALSEQLILAGHNVRAVARHGLDLAPLRDWGIETHTGDIGDAEFMTNVLRGADGVFLMVPPATHSEDTYGYQTHLVDSAVQAVKDSGVPRVVAMTGCGAHLDQEAGILRCTHRLETELDKLQGVEVLKLRPAYFMENLLETAEMVKRRGVLGSPLKKDQAFPWVAARDVADKARRGLVGDGWKHGDVQNVLGPRDYTPQEAAQAIGQAIGKPDLPYEEWSTENAIRAYRESGMSESAASDMARYEQSINEGKVFSETVRDVQSISPTPLEDVALEFARKYGGQASGVESQASGVESQTPNA